MQKTAKLVMIFHTQAYYRIIFLEKQGIFALLGKFFHFFLHLPKALYKIPFQMLPARQAVLTCLAKGRILAPAGRYKVAGDEPPALHYTARRAGSCTPPDGRLADIVRRFLRLAMRRPLGGCSHALPPAGGRRRERLRMTDLEVCLMEQKKKQTPTLSS